MPSLKCQSNNVAWFDELHKMQFIRFYNRKEEPLIRLVSILDFRQKGNNSPQRTLYMS